MSSMLRTIGRNVDRYEEKRQALEMERALIRSEYHDNDRFMPITPIKWPRMIYAGTVTGRMSSSAPNLQNLPRHWHHQEHK